MLENKPFGLYLHVPFCARKCGYCDFYSVEGRDLAEPYVLAVEREIDALASSLDARCVDTLYFGGGTPSFLPAPLLSRLMNALAARFDLSACTEKTIECNPGTLTPDSAQAFRSMGFNRVSLGAQSFNERELRFLNRIHSAESIFESVEALQSAGFVNLNLDLIFGIPGQNIRDLESNVRRALRLSPTHLSVYGLTVEEGTPLYGRFLENEFKKVHDETYEAMFLTVHAILESQGFAHYEISNYAKPGREARHNLNCWRGRDYYGFGPTAHSRAGIRSYANAGSLEQYLANPLKRRFMNDLTDDQARLERIMLSLRTREGLPRRVCGSSRSVDMLKARHLLSERDGRVALTPEGMLVIDEIILLLEGDKCLTLN